MPYVFRIGNMLDIEDHIPTKDKLSRCFL